MQVLSSTQPRGRLSAGSSGPGAPLALGLTASLKDTFVFFCDGSRCGMGRAVPDTCGLRGPRERGPRPHRQQLACGLRMCLPLTRALDAGRGLDPARRPRSPVCEARPVGPSRGEASGSLLPVALPGSQLRSRAGGWGAAERRLEKIWGLAADAAPSKGALSVSGFCLLLAISFQRDGLGAGSVLRSQRVVGLPLPS